MKRRIASWLIRIARRLDPPNPEYMKFVMDQIAEATITGRSAYKITKVVDPADYFEKEESK